MTRWPLGVLHPTQRTTGRVRLLGDLLAACVDFRRHTVLVSLQHHLRLNAQIILFRDAFRAVALRIIRKAAYRPQRRGAGTQQTLLLFRAAFDDLWLAKAGEPFLEKVAAAIFSTRRGQNLERSCPIFVNQFSIAQTQVTF